MQKYFLTLCAFATLCGASQNDLHSGSIMEAAETIKSVTNDLQVNGDISQSIAEVDAQLEAVLQGQSNNFARLHSNIKEPVLRVTLQPLVRAVTENLEASIHHLRQNHPENPIKIQLKAFANTLEGASILANEVGVDTSRLDHITIELKGVASNEPHVAFEKRGLAELAERHRHHFKSPAKPVELENKLSIASQLNGLPDSILALGETLNADGNREQNIERFISSAEPQLNEMLNVVTDALHNAVDAVGSFVQPGVSALSPVMDPIFDAVGILAHDLLIDINLAINQRNTARGDYYGEDPNAFIAVPSGQFGLNKGQPVKLDSKTSNMIRGFVTTLRRAQNIAKKVLISNPELDRALTQLLRVSSHYKRH